MNKVRKTRQDSKKQFFCNDGVKLGYQKHQEEDSETAEKSARQLPLS